MDKAITLSKISQSLIDNFKVIKPKLKPDESSRLSVSQTVSFFAIVYERIRNAVEYRDEHLIRRAAIERILKRRLLLNPQGTGEAENLLRELLWARYFAEGTLGQGDNEKIQNLINIYVKIRGELTVGQVDDKRVYYSQFLFDILTCEIEETLDPEGAKKTSLFTFFLYQVLKNRFKVEKVANEEKEAFLYVGVERAYAKSDNASLRYHLFILSHQHFLEMSEEQVKGLLSEIPASFTKIDRIIKNPNCDKLTKYIRQQMPSFLILFEIIARHAVAPEKILGHSKELWRVVDQICREKYEQTSGRLRTLAIRSIIYIFLTKMVFALILEYPLSLYIFGVISWFSVGVNSLFPPFLMLLIILFVKVPGEGNTKRIFDNIVDIIDSDQSFENDVAYVIRAPRIRRPMMIFAFTIFYSLTFIITFTLIYEILTFLDFNYISILIFVFFVSVVSFFGYRVSLVAKEYKLPKKESFFSPFVDFFFMPVLSSGKFLSSEIARLNFFIVILDFLIEAPFKLIFEVVEEWIAFVKARKEEII